MLKLLIFNPLTRLYIYKVDRFIPILSRRQKSIMVDMLSIMVIFLPFIAVPMVLWITSEANLPTEPFSANPLYIINNLLFSAMMVILLNKDFYFGRSIAKRRFGYQVTNKTTGTATTSLQCFIRNLTLIVWPIEVIPMLINPKRRIGDYIAGTVAKERPPENPELILAEMEDKSVYAGNTKLLIISIVFVLLLLILGEHIQ